MFGWKTNTIGKRKLLVANIFVGNIDNEDIPEYVKMVSESMNLHKFKDVVVVYVPTRNEDRPALERVF